MIHPIPPGTRDVLPDEMRELRRLQGSLLDVFENYGYGEVRTPTIEYADVVSLGDEASAEQDSFTDGLLDCPHYTRPETVEGLQVPAVLLSGDHGAIERWRRKQALGRTWLRRPELLHEAELDEQSRQLLAEFKNEFEASRNGGQQQT